MLIPNNIYINKNAIGFKNKKYKSYDLFAVEEYKNKTDSQVSYYTVEGKFLGSIYRTKKSHVLTKNFVLVQELSDKYIPLVGIYILFKDFS